MMHAFINILLSQGTFVIACDILVKHKSKHHLMKDAMRYLNTENTVIYIFIFLFISKLCLKSLNSCINLSVMNHFESINS